MIDVTDIPNVKEGTKVYIWDNEIITLDEIAKNLNTINIGNLDLPTFYSLVDKITSEEFINESKLINIKIV